MKSSFFFPSWTQHCLLLFVFTTLPISEVRGESPIKRTLVAIKQRVGHALRVIGSEIAQDSPKSNKPSTSAEALKYEQPPMASSQQEPVIPYSATADAPDIDLRNSTSTAANPAVLPTNQRPLNPPSVAPQSPRAASPISYAKPVPGHPGFVYPPGITEELKNMLDVRGCASGEKMRDPRTGVVFLVP